MGRLAKAAGTSQLKGRVCVTDALGLTTTYADEEAAEAGVPAGSVIEHRRGAFFVGAKAPAPADEGRSRRRRTTSDES